MSSHTGSGVGLGVGTGVGVGVGVGLGVGVGSGVTVVEASEDGDASLELVSPEQPLNNSSAAHRSRARIFFVHGFSLQSDKAIWPKNRPKSCVEDS